MCFKYQELYKDDRRSYFNFLCEFLQELGNVEKKNFGEI